LGAFSTATAAVETAAAATTTDTAADTARRGGAAGAEAARPSGKPVLPTVGRDTPVPAVRRRGRAARPAAATTTLVAERAAICSPRPGRASIARALGHAPRPAAASAASGDEQARVRRREPDRCGLRAHVRRTATTAAEEPASAAAIHAPTITATVDGISTTGAADLDIQRLATDHRERATHNRPQARSAAVLADAARSTDRRHRNRANTRRDHARLLTRCGERGRLEAARDRAARRKGASREHSPRARGHRCDGQRKTGSPSAQASRYDHRETPCARAAGTTANPTTTANSSATTRTAPNTPHRRPTISISRHRDPQLASHSAKNQSRSDHTLGSSPVKGRGGMIEQSKRRHRPTWA
jgi:hypothetical protein